MAVTYRLTNARIAATLSGAGAVVETGLALRVDEGRTETWQRGDDSEGLRELEYQLQFSAETEREGTSFEGVDARIVIEGTHENGRRMEIRGEGLIGFNEHGDVEGWFEQPPRILIEDDGEDVSEPDAAVETFYDEMPRPKPSEQFARALHGRILSDVDQSD